MSSSQGQSEEISITLASTSTGQSDSISVDATSTTLSDLMEWAKALLGLSGNLRLFKDGKGLIMNRSTNLKQAGIVHGDLIAVQPVPTQPPAAAPVAGGLDFSSLLASAPAPAAPQGIPPVTYYPGMHLDDAIELNPHPQNFCSLVLQHDHLWKELNYHSPTVAQKIKNAPSLADATAAWREELVKGSIRGAYAKTRSMQKERDMRARLDKNANDQEAKEYFESKTNQTLVEAQYREAMQNYPETMGKVLMLYIEAKVNEHSIQAFVDSGAQNTIMSKRCAEACGILHLVDKRFAGTAVGVGTGKILGRIHIVSLRIGGSHHFPCSVTVMDDAQGLGDKNMDFLLGLDMLKRHLCMIDLEHGCVRFKLEDGQHLEAPFLHEKDLDEAKGGTRGFDADKANQELAEMRRKAMQEEDAMDEDDTKPSGDA